MAKNTRTTMTRKDIISAVADMHDMTKANAEVAVNAVFGTVKSAIEEGNNVSIHEFGTFTIKTLPARTGRNPSNGESLEIPESNKVVFKPTNAFKKTVKVM